MKTPEVCVCVCGCRGFKFESSTFIPKWQNVHFLSRSLLHIQITEACLFVTKNSSRSRNPLNATCTAQSSTLAKLATGRRTAAKEPDVPQRASEKLAFSWQVHHIILNGDNVSCVHSLFLLPSRVLVKMFVIQHDCLFFQWTPKAFKFLSFQPPTTKCCT